MVFRVRRALGLYVVTQVLLAGMLGRCAHAQDVAAKKNREEHEAIVFIAPPGLGADTNLALEEAVGAQVSLVGAKLVFLTAEETDAGLEERLGQAEELARKHRAVGVFWIDARPSGRWFLYIMDRNGAHVVVRPLTADNSSMDAAIEAAAVIAGSASDALLKQQSVEARLGPPRRRPPPPQPEDELRLEVTYAGTIFSPSVPWIHGVGVGVSWLWPAGPYVGIGYVWSPPIRVVDEATLELTRHPVMVHGGMRLALLPSLEVGGELALGMEVRARSTTDTIFELRELDEQTRTVLLAGLRLAAEWRLLSWMGLIVRVSPEFVLNSFDYEKQTDPGKPPYTILSPYQLRFTGYIGLTLVR
jgi:hypothetical protein